jgi:hypothetical protein
MEPSLSYARTTDGVSIAYTLTGEGPVLVWLPPAPLGNVFGQWRVPRFRHAYERLGEHVRLLLHDGRTPKRLSTRGRASGAVPDRRLPTLGAFERDRPEPRVGAPRYEAERSPLQDQPRRADRRRRARARSAPLDGPITCRGRLSVTLRMTLNWADSGDSEHESGP